MLSRLVPRTFRGQLVLVLMLAVLAAQALGTVLLLEERRAAVRTALGDEVIGRTANVVALLEESPPSLHRTILGAADSPLVRFRIDQDPLALDIDGMGAAAVERRLRLLLGGPGSRTIGVRTQVLPVDAGLAPLHNHNGGPPHMPGAGPDRMNPHMAEMHRRMVAFHGAQRGALELALSVSLADNAWLNVATQLRPPALQLAWRTLSSTALLAIAIAAAVWICVRRLTRPLQNLAGQADRLGRGEEAMPLATDGPTELRQAIEAFNVMQDRVRRFVQERTQVVSALAHDLRSPLTAMRLRVEMLEPSEDKDRLVVLVEEMEEMTEASLSFGRGVSTDEPMTEVDLAQVVEDLGREVGESGAEVDLALHGPVVVTVRPVALKRALRNLVENAIRYGDRATLSVMRKGDNALVIVSDEGPGLPEKALEQAFEPFLRLETSRSRDTGGAGLGLAIARDIVQRHGGEIVLRNRAPRGLDAVVTLPLTLSALADGH